MGKISYFYKNLYESGIESDVDFYKNPKNMKRIQQVSKTSDENVGFNKNYLDKVAKKFNYDKASQRKLQSKHKAIIDKIKEKQRKQNERQNNLLNRERDKVVDAKYKYSKDRVFNPTFFAIRSMIRSFQR